jgi:hypothetical protein
MDLTYYVFAFYVFLLLCAAIWFYNRVAGSRKAGGAGEEKERQLFKLYQNIEDMLSGFEEYVQESKADIDERFKQAEAVIEKISAAPEQNSAPITASGQTDEIARQPQKPAKSVKRAAKPKAKELMSQYIDQVWIKRRSQRRWANRSGRFRL